MTMPSLALVAVFNEIKCCSQKGYIHPQKGSKVLGVSSSLQHAVVSYRNCYHIPQQELKLHDQKQA